jgi:NADH-quinone oxidoreductase subunit E
MICGAEDLVAVCKELIARTPHSLSADGKFSWEEVECMGACANAPMAQIGKDYYEDLTPARLRELIARFSAGEVPVPGSQIGRYAAEPVTGLTSLTEHLQGRMAANASVALATGLGDTVKRIDGTEVPLTTPWLGGAVEPTKPASAAKAEPKPEPEPEPEPAPAAPVAAGAKPASLAAARDGKADDLTLIVGIGPKLMALCHRLGFYHFDQIAAWTPAEVAWVDENLEGFRGRVTRDKWVAQARVLAAGGSAAEAAAAAKA